jgi:hypothetical protein
MQLVQKRISEYGYKEVHDIPISSNWGDLPAKIVSTPRRWSVRYLCVLVEAPGQVVDLESARSLHRQMRVSISQRFAKFPYWKEIGTYSIVLCGHKLFETVRDHVRDFRDRTGFHTNVMLGTCFIDSETKENTANATWGLFYSGKHYGALRSAVAQWCEVSGHARPESSA